MNKTIFRKNFMLFLVVFLLAACSKENVIEEGDVLTQDETIKNEENNDEESFFEEEELDISEAIIGEWYVISGEYGNQVISFNKDGTYIKVVDVVEKAETSKGTYEIKNGKLFIHSKYGNEEMDVNIYNNVLCLSSLGFLYCRMDELFDPRCKEFNNLEGYYKDDENHYYHFKDNGELIVNGDSMYSYVANKEVFLAVIPSGASTGMIEGTIVQDLNGNKNLKRYIPQYDEPYGQIEMSLMEISEEEYCRVVGEENDFHILLVTADALKVRKLPSTKAEKVQLFFRGRLIVEDHHFETIEAEGYKWYKVGYCYIADKDGEWVKVLK